MFYLDNPIIKLLFDKESINSTCLVLSCWTGLFAILIADLLSHHTFMQSSFRNFSSLKRFLTHNISLSPCDIALYSASVVALDTTDCFLLLHETSSHQQKHSSLRLTFDHLNNLPSITTAILSKMPITFEPKPFSGVPFKYLKIL